MRISEYFLPTLKENPREAEIISHRLMLRAGMIRQMSSGIFAWLPLGLRVLDKIANIVREEQNRTGAVELLMPTLQSAEPWKQTGRYDAYGKEMLRLTDRHGREMLYGPTNEEMITEIAAAGIKSYKDLPFNLYHIQWKFRDEIRPRFGVMRGREFLMKDAYSFDLTEEDGMKAFQRMFVSYLRTFKRMGLTAIPMRAETGPIGGDASYEFIVLAKTGESEVFCHSDYLTMATPDENVDFKADLTPIVEQWTSKYAATEDVHVPEDFDKVPDDKKITARGIEVGQVFFFGTKYSKQLDAYVQGKDGEKVYLQSGSYGIGVSRLLGAIIEACHDDDGIIWPEEVAPFNVGLINLKSGNEATDAACQDIYGRLQNANIDVLYDDSNERAGGKFGRMHLLGLPWQLVVGPRGLKDGKVELKNRKSGEKQELTIDEAIAKLTQ